MTRTKLFLIIFLILGFGLSILWQFSLKEQIGFGKLATAYAAKQVCSCRYVAERPLESCKQDFTQDISLVSFQERTDKETAIREMRALAIGGLVQATAVYEPRFGCSLKP